ncbi:MAG: MgtC/SapB family protein [Planctomycetes bacterium]|nr:MgtC/SapB family protein [Planctomycetota bacterium]
MGASPPLLHLLLAAGDGPAAAAAAAPVPDLGDPFKELAQRGAIAMLIGLLVGAERQYSHTEKEQLFAGVRTFPLIGLLGFLAAFLAEGRDPLIFAGVSLTFGGLVLASYVLTSLGEDKGATTEIAGLTVYFLGALCFWGQEDFASSAAVAATVLLSMREAMHGFVERLDRDDVFAALKLAVVTLIVLPLLPRLDYGPYRAFNPHKIWTYVVLIASISFAGYVSVKALGARKGIGITGLFGGLASSTAVALAFSRKSREEPRLSRPFAGAIVIASTIMFPRVLVVAAVACPPLLGLLWKPVALLTLAGVAASLLLQFGPEKGEGHSEGVALRNPFELASAVKFGVVLAVIGFVSRASYALFGEGGFLLASGLMGMADADGLAAQAASQGKGLLEAAGGDAAQVPFLSTAAAGIVLAMAANTVVKGALTLTMGAPELRRWTLPAFGALAAIAVGAAVWILA